MRNTLKPNTFELIQQHIKEKKEQYLKDIEETNKKLPNYYKEDKRNLLKKLDETQKIITRLNNPNLPALVNQELNAYLAPSGKWNKSFEQFKSAIQKLEAGLDADFLKKSCIEKIAKIDSTRPTAAPSNPSSNQRSNGTEMAECCGSLKMVLGISAVLALILTYIMIQDGEESHVCQTEMMCGIFLFGWIHSRRSNDIQGMMDDIAFTTHPKYEEPKNDWNYPDTWHLKSPKNYSSAVYYTHLLERLVGLSTPQKCSGKEAKIGTKLTIPNPNGDYPSKEPLRLIVSGPGICGLNQPAAEHQKKLNVLFDLTVSHQAYIAKKREHAHTLAAGQKNDHFLHDIFSPCQWAEVRNTKNGLKARCVNDPRISLFLLPWSRAGYNRFKASGGSACLEQKKASEGSICSPVAPPTIPDKFLFITDKSPSA